MPWDGTVMYQSTRDDAYREALATLKNSGLVYPCSCSRREIADSAVNGIDGPVYPGTCRKGLLAGRAARAERLLTQGARVEFEDAVQGRIVHNIERQIGDFVLKRADGPYAYQLAVVVDDAAQGITDIVRGADLLTRRRGRFICSSCSVTRRRVTPTCRSRSCRRRKTLQADTGRARCTCQSGRGTQRGTGIPRTGCDRGLRTSGHAVILAEGHCRLAAGPCAADAVTACAGTAGYQMILLSRNAAIAFAS